MKQLGDYGVAAKAIIDGFSTTLTKKDCAQLEHHVMALDLLQQQFAKSWNALMHRIDKLYKEVKLEVKDAHRLASPAIRRFLMPLYESCAVRGGKLYRVSFQGSSPNIETGTGHFKRSKDESLKYIQEHGLEMHNIGATAIKTAVTKLLISLENKFVDSNNKILELIRRETTSFFIHNSSLGRSSGRRIINPAKKELRQDLQKDMDALNKAWTDDAPFVGEPIPDLSGLELERDDKYGIDNDDSDDDEDGDYKD